MVLGACGFSRYLRGWDSGKGPLILALIPVVPILPGIKIHGPNPNPLLFLLTRVLKEQLEVILKFPQIFDARSCGKII